MTRPNVSITSKRCPKLNLYSIKSKALPKYSAFLFEAYKISLSLIIAYSFEKQWKKMLSCNTK